MLLKTKAIFGDELLSLACCLATLIETQNLPRKECDIQDYLPLCLSHHYQWQTKQFMALCGCTSDLRQAIQQAHWKHIGLLLALAFPDRIAQKRKNGTFVLANGSGAKLPVEDPLNDSEYLVIPNLQESPTQQNAQIFLASKLDKSLFDSELTFLVSHESIMRWDDNLDSAQAQEQQKIGAIILTRQSIPIVDKALLTQTLIAQIRQRRFTLLNLCKKAEHIRIKVALAKQLSTPFHWPDFSNDTLIDTVESWLSPYLSGIKNAKQLGQLDLAKILFNALTWEQQQWLQKELPDGYPLATGTLVPIRYTEDGRALMSVRLQEAFGMTSNPVLADNQITVTIKLLSPAQRPIAVTADLASFWQGPYNDVKKEMRGRYPKHLWPDDPKNCEPTKLTKKKAGV